MKSFIFQLVTFLIVLFILRQWVFPRLVETLEARRKTLEESLIQAKQTEEALERAEEKATHILHKARETADQAVADAKAQAKELAAQAETAAREQTERIMKENDEHLAQERRKLHDELKGELADLVVATTEKVLKSKLNPAEDAKLIEKHIKELAS